MPELPEVETVRRVLEANIISKQIKSVDIYSSVVVKNDIDYFKKAILDEHITSIQRYGKFLFIILDNHSLIVHLRMEGKFFIKDISLPKEKHEHVIFTFYDNVTLRYHDTRKFGILKIVDDITKEDIIKNNDFVSKLGIEANDVLLTKEYLYNKLKVKNVPIKEALLDQSVICGLGNIYVDEVLFRSLIHPLRKSNLITMYECEKIVENSRIVLDKAIQDGGTTIRSYTSSLGVTGRFQLSLLIHTKKDLPCINCQTIIEKIRVTGRGTYICSNCQKINKPLIVGITGGIATGKSVVSSYLINKGYKVVDADEIVHESYNDEKIKMRIKNEFNDAVIDNKIDRKILSNIIFNNEDKRLLLNSIIHPYVFDKILAVINTTQDSIIFIDVPLLFESGFNELCNKVICVSTTKDNEIKRLISRNNITVEEALKKINSQMELTKKEQLSDYIIDNNASLDNTYKQIDDFCSLYHNK